VSIIYFIVTEIPSICKWYGSYRSKWSANHWIAYLQSKYGFNDGGGCGV